MIEFTFRPIDKWPGEQSTRRVRSRFRGGMYQDTKRRLERELAHLRAKNVVILADCDQAEIRRDGMFRANARMNGPGIILAFDSAKGPLKFPCDTYLNWDCNLRAIALSLEALRAVDRYGVTRHAEQYRGWSQLPPARGPIEAGEWASLEHASRWFLQQCPDPYRGEISPSSILEDPAELQAAHRMAAKVHHPDVGGSDEAMAKINRCCDFIASGGRA